MAFKVGNRPLRVAVTCGHANASGGNAYELRKNQDVTAAFMSLVKASTGFDVRCGTPNNGRGVSSLTLDGVVYATVHQWVKSGWIPDIVFEIHHEGLGNTSVRGGFVIYPDSAGLRGRKASGADFTDIDVRDGGGDMARIITSEIGVPTRGGGTMSERATGVGGDGWRLGYFGALSDPVFQQNSCVFISEAATYTNPTDLAIMNGSGFADREAKGLLKAIANLATSRGGWTYDYKIGSGSSESGSSGSGSFTPGVSVRVTENLNVRSGYGLSYKVVTTLPSGSTATVIADNAGDAVKDRDGYTWVNIKGSFGTGWAASNWLEIVPGKPDTPSVKAPLKIPELDRYADTSADAIPAMVDATIAGIPCRCLFVGDRVEATRQTPRYGTPNVKNADRTGGDIARGERFDVQWIILPSTPANASPVYRTPWGTFVDMASTRRVGDTTVS